MATVNQPSKKPTRKLTASVIVSAVMGWGGVILQNYAPGYFDAGVWATTTTAALAVVGYMVRDGKNG